MICTQKQNSLYNFLHFAKNQENLGSPKKLLDILLSGIKEFFFDVIKKI